MYDKIRTSLTRKGKMKDKFLEDTVERARDLGEAFTSTTVGRIIDAQRLRVENASREDPELASVLVLELAKTCTEAEQELEKF